MWESYIVAQARQWVGQQMTWVGQSSGLSNFEAIISGRTPDPSGNLTPAMGWQMTCYEMPLLAAVHSRSLTAALAAQVSLRPDRELKRTWTSDYNHRACMGGMPGAGCLVFWKMRQQGNALLNLFAQHAQGDTDKWGLDHVALATGNTAANGHSEIISFWSDNTITLTNVGAVTTAVENALGNNAVMDVTYASGPWAYY